MEVKIQKVWDLLSRYQLVLEESEGARVQLANRDVRLGEELAELVETQRELERLLMRGWEVI